jgi:hypothetical protein
MVAMGTLSGFFRLTASLKRFSRARYSGDGSKRGALGCCVGFDTLFIFFLRPFV